MSNSNQGGEQELLPNGLKSCPCCGWVAPMVTCSPHCFPEPGWQLRCDKCGLQTCWWHSKEEAFTAWNTRSDLSLQAAEPKIPEWAAEECRGAEARLDAVLTESSSQAAEGQQGVWDKCIQIAKEEAFERRMAYNVYDALIAAKAASLAQKEESNEESS